MDTETPLTVGRDGHFPLVVEKRLAQAIRMIEFGRVTFTIHEHQIVGVYFEERRNMLPKELLNDPTAEAQASTADAR